MSLALMLALLVASPTVLAQSPAAPEQPLRVVVDTAALDEQDRERMRKFLQAGVVEEIEAKGITVVEDGSATTLRVRIEYLDEEDLEYAIHYDIQHGGEIYTDVPLALCTFCVDAKLLRAINGGLPAALKRLEELAEPVEPSPLEETDPVLEEPVPEDEPEPDRIAPIGPLGFTGIGVAALGLGATIAGAVELSKGKVYEQTSTGLSWEFEDHRPAGKALLGTGVAVMAVGVALLVTDTVIRARKRKNSDSGKRAFFPVAGEGIVGAGFIQRF
ncbi:hypothetical protein ACNOYE_07925 [Nannocystaceae bacterium ST9]